MTDTRDDLISFGASAHVAIENHRASWLAAGIDQNQILHLSSHGKRRHPLEIGGERTASGLSGAPPVAGILLDNAAGFGVRWVWLDSAGDDLTLIGDQRGFERACAQVKDEPEIVHRLTPQRVVSSRQ